MNEQLETSILEKQIISTVNSSIGKAIEASLVGYQSPLNKIVEQVVKFKEDEISILINESISNALMGDFRKSLKDACTHKIAKIIVSKIEGEIEKRANELRASPEFRARLTLAIEKTVKEFTNHP